MATDAADAPTDLPADGAEATFAPTLAPVNTNSRAAAAAQGEQGPFTFGDAFSSGVLAAAAQSPAKAAPSPSLFGSGAALPPASGGSAQNSLTALQELEPQGNSISMRALLPATLPSMPALAGSSSVVKQEGQEDAAF